MRSGRFGACTGDRHGFVRLETVWTPVQESRRTGRKPFAMPPVEAKRTLVKSPPELWAELSDADALARHLGEFGEIRITRTQPESVVEWEGDLASGSVRLEPSGWGTKVT